MRNINNSEIKKEWKKGRIVIAEFSPEKDSIKRALVSQIVKESFDVVTIFGTVFPKELYSFDNAREAQEFINAV